MTDYFSPLYRHSGSNCKETCNQQMTTTTTAVTCKTGDFLDGGRCQSCVEYVAKFTFFCTLNLNVNYSICGEQGFLKVPV